MRNAEKLSLTDKRKIETLQKSGVLLESSNPSNPAQRGFRFSKACFLKHPQHGQCVRVVGFVETSVSSPVDIVCVNSSDGTRERLSSTNCYIGGHLYSVILEEGKYDNRPKSEELFIVASTKKEANSIVKELCISGFWSLDRRVGISCSSVESII